MMTRNGSGIREAVILSTCNRIETYALTYGNEDTGDSILAMLSQWGRTPIDELARHAYTLFDDAAATHLFSVASGLDSLILGEQQIQLQVRNAARIAKEAGALGPVLSELFYSADRSATRVRKEIGLGFDGSSVSSAAVSLLTSRYPNADSVLIVGAGKMMTLAADKLKSAEKCKILIANRTYQRAEALARRVSGAPWPYEEIPSALERVDAVLIFTSSNDYVINAGDVSSAIQKRPNRELILIDGSVPRNIDPQSAEISGVHLYDIDDLAPFAEAKIPQYRMSEASLIIDAGVAKFFAKLRSYQANDTLRELHQLAEEIRQSELSRAFNRMDKISSRQKEIIDILTRRIINKLLYEPTARLKEHAGNGDGESFDRVIRELFAISKENA
jgi:glutamyl-tRNA reductase